MDALLKVLGTIVSILAVGVALGTYRKSTRTKAAEFLLALHRTFFIEDDHRRIRELLDSNQPGEQADLYKEVNEESAEFTNFLNFFELVGYLTRIKTLTLEDTEALVGYYLTKFQTHTEVRQYVLSPNKGFENLQWLLYKRQR